MMMMSKDVSAMSYSLFAIGMLSSSLRGALATKQSSLPASHGLLRFARNDGMKPSHHHHDRIFDQHLERADQLGPERAVDRAVIAGHRHAHDLRDFDLAVFDDCALLAGA